MLSKSKFPWKCRWMPFHKLYTYWFLPNGWKRRVSRHWMFGLSESVFPKFAKSTLHIPFTRRLGPLCFQNAATARAHTHSLIAPFTRENAQMKLNQIHETCVNLILGYKRGVVWHSIMDCSQLSTSISAVKLRSAVAALCLAGTHIFPDEICIRIRYWSHPQMRTGWSAVCLTAVYHRVIIHDTAIRPDRNFRQRERCWYGRGQCSRGLM